MGIFLIVEEGKNYIFERHFCAKLQQRSHLEEIGKSAASK